MTRLSPLPDRRQRGIALIVALILLAVMTASGITAISMTQRQERVSAHQRQYADAFMAAETALERVAILLHEALAENELEIPDTENGIVIWTGSDITDALPDVDWVDAATAQPFGFDDRSSYFVTEIAFLNDTVQITTEGITTGVGRRNLTAVYEILGGSGGISPFEAAITACRNININGSGDITSYDSLNPGLGEMYQANVLNRLSGDVNLNGAAAIYGSVQSTGGGNIGGRIVGNYLANGNVTTNSGTQVCGSIITGGNVTTSGNFNLGPNAHADCAGFSGGASGITGNNITLSATSNVHGTVNGQGNLAMSGSARIFENANIGGNYTLGGGARIDGTLTHGGTGSAGGGTHIGTLVHNPGLNVPAASTVATRPCEHPGFDIQELMTDMRPDTDAILTGNMPSLQWNSPDQLIPYMESLGLNTAASAQDFVNDTNLEVHVTGNVDLKGWRNLEFPAGKNITMRIDGNFEIGGSAGIVIPPNVDVTFWVGGNIDFSGSGNITVGANSTLTFYVKGTSRLGNNPFQFPTIESVVQRTNENGDTILVPRMSLFSDIHAAAGAPPSTPGPNANQPSSFDISVGGASSIYGAIYAPYANFGAFGSGQLRGSVWAHNINVPGNANIRYDINLGSADTGIPGDGAGGVARLGWSEVSQ